MVKDYHKSNGKPRCALKIDLKKAFDSISWDFVLNNMRIMGFPHLFLSWLADYPTIPSDSIKINGHLEGFFLKAERVFDKEIHSPLIFLSFVWRTSQNCWTMPFHSRRSAIILSAME